MIYSYATLDDGEKRALARIEDLRHSLRYFVVQQPRRWTGLLARFTRARALRGSNSIEGINVSQEDALAAIDGEDPAHADRPTWRAVVGYRNAMDYILQRCRDARFEFTLDVILAVHFMITQDDLKSNPGNLRPGWVGVRNTETGEIVHEGVDRELLEPLLAETIASMRAENHADTILKAAMTHLNITLLHPFSDGNGRTARCLQTAMLARDGIVAPIFSSIEEYIGFNQQAYYDVLAEVGGGGWHPERSAKPWIRFCIEAHYRQAQTLLRRTRRIERVWGDLAALAAQEDLPERTAFAMLEAASGLKVRNSSYRIAAEVSNNLASRDLKALVDAGVLVAEGERRGREYKASDTLNRIWAKHRLERPTDDPFAESSEQPSLFPPRN
jgi:Fic family protein